MVERPYGDFLGNPGPNSKSRLQIPSTLKSLYPQQYNFYISINIGNVSGLTRFVLEQPQPVQKQNPSREGFKRALDALEQGSANFSFLRVCLK